MARASKWDQTDRSRLLEMIRQGISEQQIREGFGGMTSPQFSQQLKMAMVEAGEISQANIRGAAKSAPTTYQVSNKGRLTITDFSSKTGADPGAKFTIEKPRGKSTAWRLAPVTED